MPLVKGEGEGERERGEREGDMEGQREEIIQDEAVRGGRRGAYRRTRDADIKIV